MAVGENESVYLPAESTLGAELLGAHRSELRDDAFELLPLVDLLGETARDGDLLLLLRHLFEADALDAL